MWCVGNRLVGLLCNYTRDVFQERIALKTLHGIADFDQLLCDCVSIVVRHSEEKSNDAVAHVPRQMRRHTEVDHSELWIVGIGGAFCLAPCESFCFQQRRLRLTFLEPPIARLCICRRQWIVFAAQHDENVSRVRIGVEMSRHCYLV